ncbi:MAG: tryptophan--tRNA ligase [Epsilonproteobacteria bacterium]|nr:tryptophan--tRNA ligase [Campylobacterota bacterium]
MRVLTGIQPSGKLHIGNYFGAIKQIIALQEDEENELFAFIANYHALSGGANLDELKQNTLEVAVDYLSLGLNPKKTIFWVQSDVKEVLELYWILSRYTPMGLLERAHSYKDKIAKGISPSHALFSYPVLMAADILLYDSEVVPVGKDQKQHLEMTRDIAIKFNNEHGETFVIPIEKIEDEVAVVPGIDGAKMSKSYKNTIEIFYDTQKQLQKRCNKIVTDSTPLGEPLEWEGNNVFELLKLFSTKDEVEELKKDYKSGNFGHGHFKKLLTQKIWDYFEEAREKREYYLNNINEVKEILNEGAKRARAIASKKMEEVREKVGIF